MHDSRHGFPRAKHLESSTRRVTRQRGPLLVRLLLLAMIAAGLPALGLGAPASQAVSAAVDSPATGGLFVSATGRLADTRDGTGGHFGGSTSWRTYSPLGVAGIPTSGVAAVQVSLTVVTPSSYGAASLRPKDSPAPGTTALIYGAGTTGSSTNTAIVALSSDGKFEVKTDTSVALIIDIQGYFTAGQVSAGGYVPLSAPSRIVDTRSGHGLPAAALPPGATTAIIVGGSGAVPANASAVFVNLTVINAASGAESWITTFPADQPRPITTLNYAAAVTTAIGSTVSLSSTSPTTGQMKLFVSPNASAPIHLVVDVVGYYTAPAADNDTTTFQAGAERVVTDASIGAGQTVTFPVAAVGSVPAIGTGITAVAANVQVVLPGPGEGYVNVWADEAPNPGTSLVNYTGPGIRSNFAAVALGPSGGIQVYNHGLVPVKVFVDVQGWFWSADAVADDELSTSIEDPDDTPDPAELEVPSVAFEQTPTSEIVARADPVCPTNPTPYPCAITADMPFGPWPACGFSSSKYKLVDSFDRQWYNAGAKSPGRYIKANSDATLRCGLFESDSKDSKFGWRHVKDGHADDWAKYSFWIGHQWFDLADFAIMYTLADPDAVTISSHRRYCYHRAFDLRNDYGSVAKIRAVVILGETGVRIMTAFPQKKSGRGYCFGNGRDALGVLEDREPRV